MTAAAALLAALLSAPSPPAAPVGPEPPPPASEEERHQRIEVGLGRIHGAATPGFWRSLGPAAVPVLEGIARDPGQLPSRRSRAVEGLSHLGGVVAVALVRELAAEDDLPHPLRAAALRAAARLLPPADLARELRPVLNGAGRGPDRAVAAEVLAEAAPMAACAEVRARAGREEEGVRALFARALERCRARGR